MSHPDLRRLAHDNRLGIGAFSDPVNHDLTINPVSAAESATHTLTYHGGLTMLYPKAWLVFLNDFWDDWRKAEAACRDLMEGGYLGPLAPYGSGNGTYLGVVQISTVTGSVMTDSDIRALLATAIMNTDLPPPDDNTLYILCMPADVRVVFDGDSQGSCETWCGYHSSGWTPDNRRFIYSVQPAALCGACGGSFDTWTMVLAHEIAEAVTDPTAQGWYCDDCGGENADLCAWVEKRFGPWQVQGYWTNEQGNTMGAYVPESERPGHKPPEPPPPADDAWERGYQAGLVAAKQAIEDLIV